MDLLDAILDHNKNNPQSYTNKNTHNNNNDSHGIHGEEGSKNNPQGSGQEHIQKIPNETRIGNGNIKEGENIVKTKYGRTVKKPDRLVYQ